jgi:hypothetical protein
MDFKFVVATVRNFQLLLLNKEVVVLNSRQSLLVMETLAGIFQQPLPDLEMFAGIFQLTHF